MKFCIPVLWFFLLDLCVSRAAADISLSLRNKQYLPPPIQAFPISEDFSKAQQQDKFKENSYGNSRYQIFEVHNHYETPRTGGGNKQKSVDKQITFANNNYMPLLKNLPEKILFEHINAPAYFPLDDPSLDLSYLGLATGNEDSQQQIIVRHEIKNNIPANFGQSFPEKSHKSAPLSFSSIQQYRPQHHDGSAFRGPDYLPPIPQLQQYFMQPPHTTQQQDHLRAIEKTSRIQDFSTHKKVHNNKETFKGADYLPPVQQKSLLIQQNTEYQQGAGRAQQILASNNGFNGPDYLPPQSRFSSQNPANLELTSTFKGLDYQPGLNLFQQNVISKPQLKGADYLKPQTNFKGSDYLPPSQGATKQQQNSKQFTPSDQFESREYLSPRNSVEISQERNTLLRGRNNVQPQYNIDFKGPDYLAPHQSPTKAQFTGPDYLPPAINQLQVQSLPDGYDFQRPPNAEQAIEELHKLPEESPVSEVQTTEHDHNSNANDSPAKSNIDNRNLPEGYDFQKPEHSELAIKLLHSQETSDATSTQSIEGAQRPLPVYHFQKSSNAQNVANQLENLNSSQPQFRPATDNVNSFQKPSNAEQAISKTDAQQSSYENNQLQLIQNSQATDQATNFEAQPEKRQFVQSPPQPFKGPDYLPPTFRPQTFRGPDYLPPSSEYSTLKERLSSTSATKAFKAPEYLPPSSVFQNTKSSDIGFQKDAVSNVFKGPDYLPPVNNQQSYQSTTDNQFKGPDYLPPTEHQTHTMYPLSSYMANIKPNDRYGNRIPFSEYGLPPATGTTFSKVNDIAPIYRQPTPEPQYYAPTMSYTNSAVYSQILNRHTQSKTLSPQAQRALQTFMPQEIRQTTHTNNFQQPIQAIKTATILPAAKTAKAKVRTVQIVNPNAVKTLKVLESLDDAGIKTIKILGPSNELPMGKHRVVKVVSGSNEQSVQTVKIFNDHEDVLANGNAVSNEGKDNSYLPPRAKRSPRSNSNV